MNIKAILLGVVALLLAAGCSSNTRCVRVAIPPRVDLAQYPTIGLVTFASSAGGELDRLGTERFMQAVQCAQPGTRIVELGSEREVLASVSRSGFDVATIHAIKEKHGVDAIILGRLDMKKSTPNVNISAGSLFGAMNVRQDVDASLTARLMESASGATTWSRSGQATANLTNAGFNTHGQGHVSSRDTQATYGAMIDGLVDQVTADFRGHYVTRRVSKDDPAYANAGE